MEKEIDNISTQIEAEEMIKELRNMNREEQLIFRGILIGFRERNMSLNNE